MAQRRTFIPDGFGGYEMAPSFGGYEMAPNFGDFNLQALVDGVTGVVANITDPDAKKRADALKQKEIDLAIAKVRAEQAQAQAQLTSVAMRNAPAVAPKDNTMLYVGGGIAALGVLFLLMKK